MAELPKCSVLSFSLPVFFLLLRHVKMQHVSLEDPVLTPWMFIESKQSKSGHVNV